MWWVNRIEHSHTHKVTGSRSDESLWGVVRSYS